MMSELRETTRPNTGFGYLAHASYINPIPCDRHKGLEGVVTNDW